MFGLMSFAILVIELCLVFMWSLQFYPEIHVDMYGDVSDEN